MVNLAQSTARPAAERPESDISGGVDISRGALLGPDLAKDLRRAAQLAVVSSRLETPSNSPETQSDMTLTHALAYSEITSKLAAQPGSAFAGSAVSSVIENLSPEEKKLFDSYLRTLKAREELQFSPLMIRMPEVTPEQKALVATIGERAKAVLAGAVSTANASLSDEQKAVMKTEQEKFNREMETHQKLKEQGVDSKEPELGPATKAFHEKVLAEIRRLAEITKVTAAVKPEPRFDPSLLELGTELS